MIRAPVNQSGADVGKHVGLYDVVVLGAGPAGAAAALGAARLGYRVAIVSRPRAATTIEGLSARAVARLRAAGLETAARCVKDATPRFVCWGGDHGARGQEHLVDRAVFEHALRTDLAHENISTIDAIVSTVHAEGDQWHVEASVGSLRGRALLDARGRRVRRSEQRGPRLVSWSAISRQSPGSSFRGSAIVALDDGWCWFARTSDGSTCFQYVGAATERFSDERFAQKRQSAAAVLAAAGLPETLCDEAARGIATQQTHVQAAVARYSTPARGPGYLRIGDAAVAMDPLSGNGVYEALGSAQVAVAAINTYLGGAAWSALARFVDERAAELWRRSVTAAGDFYRLQEQHRSHGFWRAAAEAYECQAAQARPPESSGPGRFEQRPVLNGQRIEIRTIWVSSAWPRGIWKWNGHELARLPNGLPPTSVPSSPASARPLPAFAGAASDIGSSSVMGPSSGADLSSAADLSLTQEV